MARYAAAQNTLEAEIDAIDVVEVAGQIQASAFNASAFMPYVNIFRAPTRKGIFTQQDGMAWGDLDLDGALSTEPDETAYTPTSRSYECTGRYVDAVLSQSAIADALSMGKSLQDQIVEEIALGYIDKFDSECAALYTEAPSSTPDHEIGSSSATLTGPLIDQALELLVEAKAPKPYHLVIYTGKYRELMQIPGMREKAISGQRGAGAIVGPSIGGMDSKVVVQGYGGVLDISMSDQIVSSSGYHNIMYAVGDGTNSAIANPYFPLSTPGGIQGQKLFVDINWKSARRAVEINATTQEDWSGTVFTSTTNEWMVDIVTA